MHLCLRLSHLRRRHHTSGCRAEGDLDFERCDDGNRVDTGACRNDCTAARCGDGIVRDDLEPGEPGYESCDDGNEVDSDTCLSTCQSARCGDGVVGPGEGCDDGNDDPTDACNACQPSSCGDGVVQDGERCDDGNDVDVDACLSTCAPAVCGDGVIWADVEACDDGNADPADACTTGCVEAVCGDGIRAAEDVGYEACDDGNVEDGDCSATCLARTAASTPMRRAMMATTSTRTGALRLAAATGVLWLGTEACDDGNLEAGDGCDAQCRIERCGNGRLDLGEACDDGNLVNTDSCLSTCQPALRRRHAAAGSQRGRSRL